MSDATEAKATPEPVKQHLFDITVNNQPVKIAGPKTTGLEIKEAAIDQGVQIELDFQLAEIRQNGEREIVGDGDTVSLHENSKFVATAPDDNS
jgi:hypothetical protein